MKRLLKLELTPVLFVVVFTLTGLSVLGQQEVVIDSCPPVTTIEQGESIVLVCRVVGVLPSVALSYSWTCSNGRTCEGTEVVSGNRLRIGAISSPLHGGTFTCSVTGNGLSVIGTFTLTVTDGLALSAQGTAVRDYFIPRDSFITDSSLITSSGSSAVVACRSINGNPMWSYSNGTAVTTEATVNIYQNIRNNARSDLMIGDVSNFTNGDYTCTGTFTGGSISAELGLYVMSATSLDPPTSLMSGTVTATSIDVMWSGAGSPVNGYYIIWRRTDLGDSATAEYAQVTGATMYMLTNLFSGVTYDITVWSTDGTQVSSPVSRQVTTSESAPTVPRLLRVVNSSSCQLDWLPPAQPNGAVTYTVQYQTSGNFIDLTTGLTTTHHSAVNLPSGTSVTVRVQAVNTAGTSTSNTVVLQVPPPVAVVNTPQAVTSTSVMVSWSPASNPVIGTVRGYQLTVVILGATDNTTHSNFSVDGGSTTVVNLTSLVPGVPYIVEVRVIESVRGLGLPRASSVFFSQETDADPGVQVSNLNYNMDSNRLSWTPITLFEAHHFFNYTITPTLSSSSTQEGIFSSVLIVPYSKCSDVCSVQLTLFSNTNYSVTVAITRSTNVGTTVPVLTLIGPTTPTPNSNTECSCVLTGVISGIVTGVVVAVLTGSVTAILMYVIVKRVRISTTKTPEEVVYEDPTCTKGEVENIELSSNPAYVSMDTK